MLVIDDSGLLGVVLNEEKSLYSINQIQNTNRYTFELRPGLDEALIYSQSGAPIELLETTASSPSKVEIIKPGIIEKIGDQWTLIEKMQIKIL